MKKVEVFKFPSWWCAYS